MTKLTCNSTRSISFLSRVYSVSFGHYSIQSIWHDVRVIYVSKVLQYELYLSVAYLQVTWHVLAGCLAYKTLTCHPNHDWIWRHFPAHGSGFPSTIPHYVALVSRHTLNPRLNYTIFQISFLLQPVSREKNARYTKGQPTHKGNCTWRHEVFEIACETSVHFSNALLFLLIFFLPGLAAEMGMSFAEAVNEAPEAQLAVRPTPGAEKVCQYIQHHTPDQLNWQH